MPLYEYQCESCGLTFEVIQKFADPPVEKCRNCSGKVHRLLSAPAIQFKGSGWYITDYARKGQSGGDGATSSSDPAGKPGDAAKPADAPKAADPARAAESQKPKA